MTLDEYQHLIHELIIERNFQDDSPEETFLLMTEEVGELAKAIRQQSMLNNGDHSKKHELEDEIADVFWLLLAICDKFDVNLAAAFESKEAKNRNRSYDK